MTERLHGGLVIGGRRGLLMVPTTTPSVLLWVAAGSGFSFAQAPPQGAPPDVSRGMLPDRHPRRGNRRDYRLRRRRDDRVARGTPGDADREMLEMEVHKVRYAGRQAPLPIAATG